MSIPLLAGPLAGADLFVECAFGAVLSASSATWTWTDITTDVWQADGEGIQMRHGRANEADHTQPAQCTFRVNNSTGKYSLGGTAGVRRNTPVRVRIDLGAAHSPVVLFQGDADTFTPTWSQNGRVSTVAVSASGSLRRLTQGDAPVMSSLRRYITGGDFTPVAYWPLEDAGGATEGQALFGGTPLTFQHGINYTGTAYIGSAQFGEDSDLPASSRVATIREGGTLAAVTPGTTSAGWTLSFAYQHRQAGDPVTSGGGFPTVMVKGPDPQQYLLATGHASGGAVGILSFSFTLSSIPLDYVFPAGQAMGVWHWASITLKQSGANVVITLDIDGTIRDTETILTRTCWPATEVQFSAIGESDDFAIAHPVLQTVAAYDATWFNLADAATGWAGETATARVTRLCSENDVPLTVTGTSPNLAGPQRAANLLELLRECEAVDVGTLLDGYGAGLDYIARSVRENATSSLTLAATSLAYPPAPTNDDARAGNRATAEHPDGGTFTYTDTDGPLGTTAVGIYETSVEVNTDGPTDLRHHAGWAVHLGTAEGYRFPQICLPLHVLGTTAAASWLTVQPGDRINVTSLSTTATGHSPAGHTPLTVEGYQQTITPHRWDVEVNCSPWELSKVGTAAANTGTVDDTVLRVDSGYSTLASGISAGATSLSVATTSGYPLWTTKSDDVPLTIDLAGIWVTVTAISGTSSPQTFTVTGSDVTKAVASGTPVRLWRPAALGL